MNGAGREGKRLVIRNARPRTNTPGEPIAGSNFTTSATATLIRSVEAITAVPPQKTPESLQALYGLCEGVVSQGSVASQTLYDRIRECLTAKAELIHVAISSAPTSGSLVEGAKDGGMESDDAWLVRLEVEWKQWLDQVLMIRSVFLHLDRTFVLAEKSMLPLWDLGLDIFLKTVVAATPTGPRLTSSLLSLFHRSRNGLTIPLPSSTPSLSLLHSVSSTAYTTLFLTPLLEATAEFYGDEGRRVVDVEMRCVEGESGYLRHVRRRLEEESERAENALPVTTVTSGKTALLKLVEEHLVKRHMGKLLERGLPGLAEDFPTSRGDLALFHALVVRVNSQVEFRAAWSAWVKRTGWGLVSDPTQDPTMIQTLITFKSKTDTLVLQTCHSDSTDMLSTSRDAFEWFLNRRENKVAELIAKWLDGKMRVGSKGVTEGELEGEVECVLVLFRYTQGKDVFEAFYKRDLGKRLLLGKSASADAERSMLGKLKDECGPGFTVKLETMFKDIEVSKDITKLYQSTRGAEDPFELSVSVLTTGHWPPYPQTSLHIPPSMTTTLDRFKSFYIGNHSGRKLQWAHALDHCVVAARFPRGGRKELSVSLYQGLVLLLFEEVEEGKGLGFGEVVAQTGLDPKEAARTLQSLACGKVRVLVKTPKGKDVNPTDRFAFNVGFKDDHFKIKINQIQVKETAEEQKATTDRVFMDRSSHLQLAIVRILKSRKTIKHGELVMEVVGQIKDRFKVETREIKVAVESLIGREYLERIEGTRDEYKYLA